MTPAELAALMQIISERGLPGKHLEIGTAAGGTLCKMLVAAKHHPPFVVVDTMKYFPNQHETVLENLRKNGLPINQVDIRAMTSIEACKQAHKAGETFDFVLIDGIHKFLYVMQDLRWAQSLNVSGILVLHDYSANFPGVQWAADYFLSRNPNYRKVKLADSLLVLEKSGDDPVSGVVIMPAFFAQLIHFYLQAMSSIKKRMNRWRQRQP